MSNEATFYKRNYKSIKTNEFARDLFLHFISMDMSNCFAVKYNFKRFVYFTTFFEI